MRRRWNPDLSLHGRIAIALAAAGSLLLAMLGVSTVILLASRDSQSEVVDHYYLALRTSQDYFVGMLDSETAVRGYALSGGEDSTLEPLRSSGHPWATPIASQVSAQLPEHHEAVAKLELVQTAAKAWYNQWAAPTIQRTAQGQQTKPAEVAQGVALFNDFRATYGTYISALRSERLAAAEHLKTLTNLLFDATLAIGLLAVATCLILWALLRGWVSRPVRKLSDDAQAVSDGDLSHRVEGTGPKEFVQLGETIEAMRARLVRQIAAIESSQQEVLDARGRVEEQAEELQRSNRELEQFAYVASHDLQEPLRKVASFCQLLERRYAGQLDERAIQYIHFAVDGARRMQQLINDLLDFSRVGRLSTSPATHIDTAVCLRAALSNVETSIHEGRATIDVQTELPVVPGEAPLITQLFQNLVANAIKFHSDEPPVVTLGALRTGSTWEFWCADNGIGIPAEYADRVFLIFQRLHPKEVYEGTGIGLAMCKKIVEYHGGRIWVQAPDPQRSGATIRWTLPAEVLAPAAAEPAADLEPSPAAP